MIDTDSTENLKAIIGVLVDRLDGYQEITGLTMLVWDKEVDIREVPNRDCVTITTHEKKPPTITVKRGDLEFVLGYFTADSPQLKRLRDAL